jgi:hypothetical protein
MINFDKILYTPLDIPKLQFTNKDIIVEQYNIHSNDIVRRIQPTDKSYWQGITCYKGPNFDPEMLLYPGSYVDMKNLLEDEIDILNSYLPLEVESISLWTNTQYVPSHVDKRMYNTSLDFRFRFIISQEKKSFFIDYNGIKRHITLPDSSNIFCFNNQIMKHGATYEHDNFKILGVIRGKINNEKKFSELLEASIIKYNEYHFNVENISKIT